MRVILEHIESLLGLGVDKHRPIGIEKASEFFGETERAINKMVRYQEIPHYSRGRNVYFFEDDLIKWLEEGRINTFEETIISKRRW